ncbi:phosphoenolpyruvate--protein phosphotransferase [Caloramator australicus]|uniref:Phosphoenolpyruvate-protein phosphotransferase n=1 Tax=Caloramator australicus RC3 TaxID=857293 RepID=I7K6L9_9CLOT|nr:phosphoenolpyruvate--protein phosphotransferase [Caloramator australicus]CCJ33194.1 Phosphoenolpyruvate-protein phosphotransferase of PTS system [Caloramator australicus RC3]
MFKGIAASNGIAIGRAHIYKKDTNIIRYEVKDSEKEIKRLEEAIGKAKEEIMLLIEHSVKKIGKQSADIFEAHLMFLEDEEFINSIKNKIKNYNINSEYAVKSVADDFSNIFLNIDNQYFKERAMDIKDVADRIINLLNGSKKSSLSNIKERCILIAEDLTPSETVQLDKNYILGIAVNHGGKTSHAAIIARSMEIPAVVGLGNITEHVKEGDLIIIDGREGTLIINPNDEEVKKYKEIQKNLFEEYDELLKFKEVNILDKNGKRIEVASNISRKDEVDLALKYGADGIGLFRSEFLYMGRESLPLENEQFEAYKYVLEKMQGKPVIIRTLDIGGDKNISYLDMEYEQNPFLGLRAIRLCLARKDIFKTQLRALLRASKYGRLRIMFPMISGLEELLEVKNILNETEEELKTEGIDVGKYEIGIMIETPSAAIISDILAKEVDFFSIGTNDLIQYTLAVDRMNKNVSYLYNPSHEAILRLIKKIIDNAHNEGIWVGMCGEMASDLSMAKRLIEMGLDEFSVSPSLILKLKKELDKIVNF